MMNKQYFKTINAIMTALEKRPDTPKWTDDTSLYRECVESGHIVGTFDLILNNELKPTSDCIKVCRQSDPSLVDENQNDTFDVYILQS